MANNSKHTFMIFIERPIVYLDFNPFSLPCLIRDSFCRCLAERIKCISYPVEREETHDQRLWQGAQVVKTLLWLKNLFVCRIGLERCACLLVWSVSTCSRNLNLSATNDSKINERHHPRCE